MRSTFFIFIFLFFATFSSTTFQVNAQEAAICPSGWMNNYNYPWICTCDANTRNYGANCEYNCDRDCFPHGGATICSSGTEGNCGCYPPSFLNPNFIDDATTPYCICPPNTEFNINTWGCDALPDVIDPPPPTTTDPNLCPVEGMFGENCDQSCEQCGLVDPFAACITGKNGSCVCYSPTVKNHAWIAGGNESFCGCPMNKTQDLATWDCIDIVIVIVDSSSSSAVSEQQSSMSSSSTATALSSTPDHSLSSSSSAPSVPPSPVLPNITFIYVYPELMTLEIELDCELVRFELFKAMKNLDHKYLTQDSSATCFWRVNATLI
jgi:hypothetical protein